MALSDRTIDQIVELYDGGNGDSISDIAKARGITAAAVKYHLKTRGILAESKVIMNPEKPVSNEPAAQSDADLGIGAAPGGSVDLQALMANPDFAKIIDAAIAQRMQGAIPAPPRSGSEAAFDAFLSKFDHMLEVQAEQRPGYIKPLSADEVDGRKQGRTDMFALLRQFKADNIWPHYLLTGDGPGAVFYGPSANGPVLYEAGQEIRTHLPPSEMFQPLNDAAIQVFSAYKRWIGDVVPIEDLIAQAAAIARGQTDAYAPEVVNEMATANPEVQLVDTPRRDVAPKRVLGTLTPELRGRTMPGQPGIAPQPAGPIFVSEA